MVNQQLESLRSGDLKTAYSYCSAGFQESTSLSDFQEMLQAYPILKNAKEFRSNNREISNDVAKLIGTIQGFDGSTQPVEYQLVKENGVWRIQQLHMSNPGILHPQEPGQKAQLRSPDPSPPQSLEIREITVSQESKGEATEVIVKFKVLHFLNEKKEGSSRAHLIQDIQTIGPDGNIVPDLSFEKIKEVDETGTFEEYGSAEFSNTLNMTASHPHGKYTVNLTVHDRIGNQDTKASTEFELQ